MKTKNWILLFGTVLYMYLFYKQNAGINTLVYAVNRNRFCLCPPRSKQKCRLVDGCQFLHIYSATCVFIHNSDLVLMGYVFTLLVWSALTFNPYFSIIPRFVSIPQIGGGCAVLLDKKPYRNRAQFMTLGGSVRGKSVLTILIPLVIALFCFSLYKQAKSLV